MFKIKSYLQYVRHFSADKSNPTDLTESAPAIVGSPGAQQTTLSVATGELRRRAFFYYFSICITWATKSRVSNCTRS